ncbi:MAG: FtsX-like permease family protein, partial [Acidobacteriota bacterium]
TNFLGSIARLRDGVELSTLDAEVRTLGERLVAEYPAANQDRVYRAISLRQALTSDVEPITLSLLGIIAFVLLIVCANVANLLLARGATRQREVAIRRSLGASNRRLAQLLLTEALLLASAGGLLGFGLGWLGLQRMVAAIADRIPPWVQTEMDERVVLYTLAVSLAAGLLFSLLPLLQSFRFTLSSALREGGQRQGSSRRGGRLRASLVVSEVALSLVLLVGAGLMIKSLIDLTSVDPGFELSESLTVGLDLLSLREAEPEERAAQLTRYLERLASLPGVEAVGGINLFPLKGRSNSVSLVIEGQGDEEARHNPRPQVGLITPGYLQAMGIPLLAGNDFGSMQPREGRQEAIISRALAEALWPGEEAMGQRLRLVFGGPEWLEVVGITGDIHHHGLDRGRQSHLYLPYAQYAPARMVLVVRHATDSAATAAAIRSAVAEIDPNQPLHELMSTGEVVTASVWQWRFFTTIAWVFGAVALALAVVGIYGVMTYSVSQRISEVGIRMALGAGRGQVIGMILRQGGRLMLLGVVIGLPITLGLSRMLSGILFSISAFEPLALGAAVLLLGLVALPALLLPAQRAARVDPASSLRAD